MRSGWLVAAVLLALGGMGSAAPEPGRDRAVHLLMRTSLAPTAGELDRIRAQGQDAWLARQLAPPPEDPQALRPSEMRAAMLARPSPARAVLDDLTRRRLLRALRTEYPLREVMADFWFNHFPVDLRKSEAVAWNVADYEERALRPRVLGRFRDLLGAVASHPAVLANLDAAFSTAPEVNENFGREVMELYTVGQQSGYTQRDVVEVSLAFSGWTFRPGTFDYEFRDDLHDGGPRTVLGAALPAGGREQGERVLDLLAAHPSTARFVARKLAVRFVDDHPPEPLVERAAQAFRETDGNLARVVEVLLTSGEFDLHRGSKVKSPLEFVASAAAARPELAEDLATGRGDVLLEALYAMGCPYLPPDARGWPERASTWTSTAATTERVRLARRLGDPPGFPDGLPLSDAGFARR